jgi:hypothetical protein
MSDEFRAPQFDDEKDWDEDEDSGDCGAFGMQLFSGGSEECEFCSRSDECLSNTLEWEKRESKSRQYQLSNKGEEKDE